MATEDGKRQGRNNKAQSERIGEVVTEKKAKTATKRWPRKVGYYWMWSPDLGDWIIVEVTGSHFHRTQCFYTGDGRPKARRLIEQKFGFACEWFGPLEPPRRSA